MVAYVMDSNILPIIEEIASQECMTKNMSWEGGICKISSWPRVF
jgi:hypothetical protein